MARWAQHALCRRLSRLCATAADAADATIAAIATTLASFLASHMEPLAQLLSLLYCQCRGATLAREIPAYFFYFSAYEVVSGALAGSVPAATLNRAEACVMQS